MTEDNWKKNAVNANLCVRNFIDGEYIDCLGGDSIKKYSPRDGSLLYSFACGNGTEVVQAVESAKLAFEDGRWSKLPITERKSVLYKLADLVEEHKEKFALYDSLDVGTTISTTLHEEIPHAASVLRDCAEGADKLLTTMGADTTNISYFARKPVGVVGGILGWNFPLPMAAGKVGPALAMGNSLVLKPSEFTSLSTCFLAELALEAGVPPGVFNVVHGAGATVGAALASHMDVNLLSFVGSSATGKMLMETAGQSNMKRLILECGGKSPYLVFEDCPDLDAVVNDFIVRAFHNQGAYCSSPTRLLVHENVKEKLLSKIIERTAQLVPKDPLDPDSNFGAIMSEAHMNKVLSYIDSGKQEGAKLIYGGERVYLDSESGCQDGFYLQPTIFDQVNPQQKIAQEEIFGPVLSVFTFSDEEEAIKLANDSCFGLAAYGATENLGRAHRLGQRLNSGFLLVVGTSTPTYDSVVIGMEGHRQSGVGYEGGLTGLAAYTVSTAVYLLM
jgi:acyl-CoA reductase-like NAD-dependent aldehyde dehydrogenase